MERVWLTKNSHGPLGGCKQVPLWKLTHARECARPTPAHVQLEDMHANFTGKRKTQIIQIYRRINKLRHNRTIAYSEEEKKVKKGKAHP